MTCISRLSLVGLLFCLFAGQAISQTTQVKLKLADGSYLVVDDAWETPQGVWYKQGALSNFLAKEKVKKIERTTPETAQAQSKSNDDDDDHFEVYEAVAPKPTTNAVYDKPSWIYLKGGARVEADSATQSPAGVWYTRGSMSIFIDASRIDRIEAEDAQTVAQSGKKERGWSTGRPKLDSLIRQNGN